MLPAAKRFLKRISQTEEKLRRSNFDPEVIWTIRYRVDKVMEEGRIPEKKDSVLEKLEWNIEEVDVREREGKKGKKPVIGWREITHHRTR